MSLTDSVISEHVKPQASYWTWKKQRKCRRRRKNHSISTHLTPHNNALIWEWDVSLCYTNCWTAIIGLMEKTSMDLWVISKFGLQNKLVWWRDVGWMVIHHQLPSPPGREDVGACHISNNFQRTILVTIQMPQRCATCMKKIILCPSQRRGWGVGGWRKSMQQPLHKTSLAHSSMPAAPATFRQASPYPWWWKRGLSWSNPLLPLVHRPLTSLEGGRILLGKETQKTPTRRPKVSYYCLIGQNHRKMEWEAHLIEEAIP